MCNIVQILYKKSLQKDGLYFSKASKEKTQMRTWDKLFVECIESTVFVCECTNFVDECGYYPMICPADEIATFLSWVITLSSHFSSTRMIF